MCLLCGQSCKYCSLIYISSCWCAGGMRLDMLGALHLFLTLHAGHLHSGGHTGAATMLIIPEKQISCRLRLGPSEVCMAKRLYVELFITQANDQRQSHIVQCRFCCDVPVTFIVSLAAIIIACATRP